MRLRASVLLVFLTSVQILKSQESAMYLQSAIRDLTSRHTVPTVRHTDTLQIANEGTENRRAGTDVPTLSLTKGELAALYEAAVAKGHTIQLDAGGGPMHAVVHHIEDSPTFSHGIEHPTGGEMKNPSHTSDESEFYYYYYPLKSFIDEMTPAESQLHVSHYDHHHEHTTPKSLHQFHSHTHQHNVKIMKETQMMEPTKKKQVEPLFMAVTGFIGMALMLVLSMIFLPKLGKLKSRDVKQTGYGNITTMGGIILKAIEGHDCSERIACEMGQTARAFNLYDNRFVKLFKRLASKHMGKQIDKVGKYTDKKYKCYAIPCKGDFVPSKQPKKNLANKKKH